MNRRSNTYDCSRDDRVRQARRCESPVLEAVRALDPPAQPSRRARLSDLTSNAHSANHVYATFAAAANDPAHPGDTAKVVQITMNSDLFDQLFANGKTSADLRHDL